MLRELHLALTVFGGSFLQTTEVSRTCRGRGIESRTPENTDRKQFSVKVIYVMRREHSSREGNLDARLEADCHTMRIAFDAPCRCALK